MREPPTADPRWIVAAPFHGRIARIDNRKIALAAKLAGAPEAKAAGVLLHVRTGDIVSAGQPLFEVHAQSRGELDYALDYVRANMDMIAVEAP